MSTGSLVTTIAATDSGMVTYMKMPDGSILAEYNTITNDQVQDAQSSHDQNIMQETTSWSRCENITCTCNPTSYLATYAFGSKVAIFHAYGEALCYWIHEPFNPSSSCTDANRVQLPRSWAVDTWPRSDTQLSVTGDPTGDNILLLYETKNGYLACIYAKAWSWGQSNKLAEIAPGSGFAVVSWGKENHDSHVYCQNKYFSIQEYYRIGDDDWQRGATIATDPKGLTNIAATQWTDEQGQTEMRVYFQTDESSIREKCFMTKNGWYGGDVIVKAFAAPFTVLAFDRGTIDNPVVSVWIVYEDGRVLVQKAFNLEDGWIGPLYQALPRTL